MQFACLSAIYYPAGFPVCACSLLCCLISVSLFAFLWRSPGVLGRSAHNNQHHQPGQQLFAVLLLSRHCTAQLFKCIEQLKQPGWACWLWVERQHASRHPGLLQAHSPRPVQQCWQQGRPAANNVAGKCSRSWKLEAANSKKTMSRTGTIYSKNSTVSTKYLTQGATDAQDGSSHSILDTKPTIC